MSPKSLTTLLAQVEQAGIYRLSVTDCTVLERSAEALSFACFKVDLEEACDINAILTSLGRQLDFPDWYGANLDALSDCLTDFSWREAQGYIITLSGADALQVLPDSFATLNAVFASAIEQWQDQGVPFWVFYEFGSTEVTAGLASLPVINLQ
jgi:hypothetical protein